LAPARDSPTASATVERIDAPGPARVGSGPGPQAGLRGTAAAPLRSCGPVAAGRRRPATGRSRTGADASWTAARNRITISLRYLTRASPGTGGPRRDGV